MRTLMAAVAAAGTLADAQTTRGAATIPTVAQNFTPIERAACGPHPDRYRGPFHRRVCRYGYCWCAHR